MNYDLHISELVTSIVTMPVEETVVTQGGFLTLLAEGAPTQAFDELRRVLEGGGASGWVADEGLERSFAEALHVRDALERHRRSERELRALFASAGDLAALHDVDAVLAAVCRRARTLLSSDAAWITLDDPERGDTYMRATDGIVTQQFHEIRLPYGTGLGGLVAQRGTPAATDDYLADAHFLHAPFVDRAIADEGLRGMLAVPLRRPGRVVGVLLVGERGGRQYLPDEVALVESLAAHAAIALENAELLESSRRAVERLRQSNAAVHERVTAAELCAATQSRIARQVLDGAGLDDVLGVVAAWADCPAALLGADRSVLAGAGGEELVGRLSQACSADREQLAAALEQSEAEGMPAAAAVPGLPRCLAMPLRCEGELLGWLVLAIGDAPSRTALELERVGCALTLALVGAQAGAVAELGARGELLGELLDGACSDPDAFGRRARRLRLELAGPLVVVVVRHATSGAWIPRRAARIAAAAGGIAAAREERLVFLLPAADAAEAAAALAAELAEAGVGSVLAAGAGPVDGVELVPEAYAEASACVRVLSAFGHEHAVVTREQLGLFGLLFAGAAPGDLDRFIAATLGGLMAVDEERGTDLLHTLQVFLERNGHMANTARALHVHVNTLYQRLARLDALLGDDWREPGRRIELHAALRLRELSGQLVERAA